MGKTVKPLRRQVVTTFYKILLLSMGATILTWGIALIVMMANAKDLQPANHYEKQIPDILTFAEQLNEQILVLETKEELEERIPLEGMDYQVLDRHGKLVYGSTDTQYIHNERELMESLNQNIYKGNNIIRFYPMYGEEGDFIGALGFRYKLTLAASNPQLSLMIYNLSIISFLCPFIYFSLFSFWIGKRFSRRMETPFRALMEGVKKVQNHDLDFQLVEFKTVKELQQLVEAFDEMRVALKDSLLRQWQIEEERKEMVAAIAHDLRTPLTIIHGHVEGLLAGGVNDKERADRYLRAIHTSTERAVVLMDQLNTVSIIDHPTFSINREPVDLSEFIEQKKNEFELLCEEKQIIFTTWTEFAATKSTVALDSQRMSQVLDNIVSNSIRFTPVNGEIRWKTVLTESALTFEITDTGPGFQNEKLERVFTKFFREDPARAGGNANFGLGLYIAQKIVKKHNGTILAQNEPSGGASIKITIYDI